MPLQLQEEMTYEGKLGVSTMTFELISYGDHLPQNSNPKIFSEMMRQSKEAFLTFHSDLFPREVQVTFQEILDENKEFDPERSVLRISTKFLPNKSLSIEDK
jgi:hypothetical protein